MVKPKPTSWVGGLVFFFFLLFIFHSVRLFFPVPEKPASAEGRWLLDAELCYAPESRGSRKPLAPAGVETAAREVKCEEFDTTVPVWSLIAVVCRE